MNELKWTDKELLLAYADAAADLDMLGSMIRQRGITWQALAEAGIMSRATVQYVTQERGCTGSLAEARAAVQAYVAERRAEALRRLLFVLKASK